MSEYKVNFDGSLIDLTDIFHPLIGDEKAPVTNFLTERSDEMIDLNQVFEPIASGEEIPFDTSFEADGVDLRKIFAAINTVNVTISTASVGYVDYNNILYTYVIRDKDMIVVDPMTVTDLRVQLSTQPDMSSLIYDVPTTHTELGFNSTSNTGTYIFRGLNPCVTYYTRLIFNTSQTIVKEFHTNHGVTNPCAGFSVTKISNTITVTTTPETNVSLAQEKTRNSGLKALVRPLVNDEEGDMYVAIGEANSFNCNDMSQTGSGRVVFDAGFPKFYNYHWNDWTDKDGSVYDPGAPGGFAYFVNTIDYISENRASKSKKVLYINDDSRDAGRKRNNGTNLRDTSHGLGVHIHAYNTCVEGLVAKAGYTLEYLNGESRSPVDESNSNRSWADARYMSYVTDNTWKSHWRSMADTTLNKQYWVDTFSEYDCVVYITGGTYDFEPSNGFKQGLFEYIYNGGGVFFLTDHDIFQYAVNRVIEGFGLQFYGNMDRTTSDDAYKISTILNNTNYIPNGWHPLFDNIHNTGTFHAGVSEGKIRYTNNISTTFNKVTDASGVVTFDITGHTGASIIKDANDCGVILGDLD